MAKDRKKRKDMIHMVEVDGRKFKYDLEDKFPACKYCDLRDFCDRHQHVEYLCDAIKNSNYFLKEMRMES